CRVNEQSHIPTISRLTVASASRKLGVLFRKELLSKVTTRHAADIVRVRAMPFRALPADTG
ncbi:MAG: hypothetical protein ACJAX5_002599, partial [Patiriisocius sp.]